MLRAIPVVLLVGCYTGPLEVEPSAWMWEHPYVGALCASTPGPSLSQARADSIPERRGRETVDDEWAAIAREVPGGWGGRFKVDNRLTIYMVHPEQLEEAIPVLMRLGAGVGSRPDVLEGRWDFAQLYDWRRYIRHNGLWSIEGINSSSIRESKNRIEYGVTPEDLPELAQLLSDLQVPCGLVVATVSERDPGW